MIRINPSVVYGTFTTKFPKYKADEEGRYITDENGCRIQDGWQRYTYHLVWANCLCASIYKYRDEDGKKKYAFNYCFFSDAAHARRCFKHGWHKDCHIVSARLNIATQCGRSLLPIFVQYGVKVTPYYKPLKNKKPKLKVQATR